MSQTISKTIEYLNSLTGSDYSDKFPATVNALTQLIKMGYGLPDFKKVIDKKWHDWKEPNTIITLDHQPYSVKILKTI